jgi:hypothetical protein
LGKGQTAMVALAAYRLPLAAKVALGAQRVVMAMLGRAEATAAAAVAGRGLTFLQAVAALSASFGPAINDRFHQQTHRICKWNFIFA